MKIKKTIKTKLIFAIIFTLASTFVNAQLKGSGKIITKNYEYNNFDKISFEDLNGNIEVEIGKAWSISITIDDNLVSLLDFKENKSEHELKIQFKANRNNRMYIENTNTIIKITLPEASVIKNIGNSDLTVSHIIGRYFRLVNTGNGNTTLSGRTDKLDVVKTGNGDVDAEALIVTNANLKSTGNGNVIVNVSKELSGKLIGNGDLINKGNAKFDSNSKKIGNGKLIEQ